MLLLLLLWTLATHMLGSLRPLFAFGVFLLVAGRLIDSGDFGGQLRREGLRVLGHASRTTGAAAD